MAFSTLSKKSSASAASARHAGASPKAFAPAAPVRKVAMSGPASPLEKASSMVSAAPVAMPGMKAAQRAVAQVTAAAIRDGTPLDRPLRVAVIGGEQQRQMQLAGRWQRQ